MTSSVWRLLVVDGDTDVRNVVEDLLVDRGFEVHHAADAEEATSRMGREAFDVVLCHLEALRARGGRLARRARELDPRPRVVAMSATGSHAGHDEADANLAKPFSRRQLLAILRPPGDFLET